MSTETRLAAWEQVEGWCPVGQGQALYSLARQAPSEGVIVEVGSWKGASTAWIGWGSLDGPGVPVYAVDGFSDPSHGDKGRQAYVDPSEFSVLAEFEANMVLCGVDGVVNAVPCWSPEAAIGWDRPITFLYIDGLHTPEGVRADWEAWSPHVVPGCVIAFDDVQKQFRGVYDFVREELPASRKWEELGQQGINGRLTWGRYLG